MILYVIRRFIVLLLQLLVVVCGVFVILRLLPADPTVIITPEFAGPEEREAARVQLGLDQSIASQLGDYLGGLLRGDLGMTWTTNRSVSDELRSRIPITLQVVVLSLAVAVALALLIGRAAAARVGSRFDRAALNYTLFASAQPGFFWALVAIFVFFTQLAWAPAPLGLYSFDVSPPTQHTRFILIDALIDGNFHAFFDVLWHLAIPVLVLALLLVGPLLKMTRQSLLTAYQSDYVLYSRISGLAPRTSKRYALRNALPPVITLIGVFFAGTLGGVVLIEQIFAFPGVALFALESTSRLDYPAIQGCVLVLTAIALFVYLIMDILYAVLDPRVAFGKVER